MTLAAIEESMRGRPKTLGMLLPPLGDLSHLSILYYCMHLCQPIALQWSNLEE